MTRAEAKKLLDTLSPRMQSIQMLIQDVAVLMEFLSKGLGEEDGKTEKAAE